MYVCMCLLQDQFTQKCKVALSPEDNNIDNEKNIEQSDSVIVWSKHSPITLDTVKQCFSAVILMDKSAAGFCPAN